MAIVDPDFDMTALDRPPQDFVKIATQQGQIWWLAKFIVAINNVFDDVNATITTLPEGSSPTVDVTFDNDQASFDFKIPVITGEPGQAGQPGTDGVGIENIVFNPDYTMTITTTDGDTYTSQSLRGETGATGATGAQGATGATGATGNGISNIVFNADYTMTITTTDGNTWTSGSLRGPQGEQGPAGSGGGGVYYALDTTNSSSTATRTVEFDDTSHVVADGEIVIVRVLSGIRQEVSNLKFTINGNDYIPYAANNRIFHLSVQGNTLLVFAVDEQNKHLWLISRYDSVTGLGEKNTYCLACDTGANYPYKNGGRTELNMNATPYYDFVAVRFTYGNTSDDMYFTLFANDTAQRIYYKGAAVSSSNPLYLNANDVLILSFTQSLHWEVIGIISDDYMNTNVTQPSTSAQSWDVGDINEFDEGTYYFNVYKTNGVYHGSISAEYIGAGLTVPGSWTLFATLDATAYGTVLLSSGVCDVLSDESNGLIEINISPKANLTIPAGDTVTVDFMAV